jgi:hypothetical protein
MRNTGGIFLSAPKRSRHGFWLLILKFALLSPMELNISQIYLLESMIVGCKSYKSRPATLSRPAPPERALVQLTALHKFSEVVIEGRVNPAIGKIGDEVNAIHAEKSVICFWHSDLAHPWASGLYPVSQWIWRTEGELDWNAKVELYEQIRREYEFGVG